MQSLRQTSTALPPKLGVGNLKVKEEQNLGDEYAFSA